MALSEQYVDRIFLRLTTRYGAAWLRMWDGIPMEAVRADWAEELAGFNDKPEALKHALEHLPVDRPPNSAQFRALCIGKPEIYRPALEAPAASPAVVAAARAVNVDRVDPKAWAHELRRRELACDRLTPAQRGMWRAALFDPKPEAGQ